MSHIYNSTAHGLMMWANSELEHVGRIAAIDDEAIQYSYALSTVNGMAHLKDAIAQYVERHPESPMTSDLLIIHDQVIRVMKHLIATYSVNLETIQEFNTKKILSSLEYLQLGGKHRKGTMRKNRKTRKY